jgi:hypothetical protein
MWGRAAISLVIGVVLSMAACSASGSDDVPPTTLAERVALSDELETLVADVDLRVTMMPGSGRGPAAERLVRDLWGEEIVSGTADHIASVSTPEGQVDLVAFQQRAPAEIRGFDGEFLSCFGEFGPNGGSLGCGEPITEPQVGGGTITEGPGGRNSASAYGGNDASFAILATDQGATIGITTHRGWAYANWPSAWGSPDTITFYDRDGNPSFESSYDLR